MALTWDDEIDVLIKETDGVKINSLRTAFERLIDNDNVLIPANGKTPKLWEATWINDPINISGYKKGDAVWLNTDTIENIVRNREGDIYNYASNYQGLKNDLDKLIESGNTKEYYALLKKFANGETEYTKQKLYFIGDDLTQKAQIRVSKTDNNKTYPTDNDNWEDFFHHFTKDDIIQEIQNITDDQTSLKIVEHVNEYHLPNAMKSSSDWDSVYLKQDFSNIKYTDKITSHSWYKDTIQGFDNIRSCVVKNYINGCYKSFKLWRSGFLEHSGIIDTSSIGTTGDSMDNCIITINLNWNYSNGTAPIYDYPIEQINDFYQTEKFVRNGADKTVIAKPSNGYTKRYNVMISVINNNGPYSQVNNGIYDNIEIYDMENDRFSIVIPNFSYKRISYRVNGYTIRNK